MTRTIRFGDGRELLVRAARADDASELRELFDSLDDDDRHRRFFCAFHPSEAFCLAQVTVAEHGGARLVAISSNAATGERRLVAEAGFSRMPAGGGELSITIAQGWRGWLGAFLLDLLCDVAAALGVANLEADVLLSNEPMLSLLRARGAAVVEHDGFSAIRLRIGTTGTRPSWEGIEHPRVLIEAPGARWYAEAEARDARVHVLTCHGPRSGGPGCPVLNGEPCPLVAGADVVVVSHPRDDWAPMLAAQRTVHPAAHVIVEAPGRRDAAAVLAELARNDSPHQHRAPRT